MKPNFVFPDPGAGTGQARSFLYVGRLSPEKGLHAIMRAWERSSASLKIVGDGPMREEIETFASEHSNVEFSGKLSLAEVIDLMGQARCLIMPSQWYETFGRTIAEAFSRGTPVIASDLGAMSELVKHGENGRLFQPGNVNELQEAVNRVDTMSDVEYGRQRASARETFESSYTRDVNYSRLMEIYESAKDRRRANS